MGGHTVSNIIVMAFSPRNIVGCLLRKVLQREGGHGHPRTPLATPLFKTTRSQCYSLVLLLKNRFNNSFYKIAALATRQDT